MFSKKFKNSNKKKTTALRLSVPSIIVSDLNISGDLVSDGAIEIGGKVYGNIRCNVVTIRKGAYIKGDIIANELLVQGKVEGTIQSRSVNLANSAEVVGEVTYSYLSIDAGADIDGSCKKVADKDAYEMQSDAEKSIEYIPSLSDVLEDDEANQNNQDNQAGSDNIAEENSGFSDLEIEEFEVQQTDPIEERDVANDVADDLKNDDSVIEINLFDVDADLEQEKPKKKAKKKKKAS